MRQLLSRLMRPEGQIQIGSQQKQINCEKQTTNLASSDRDTVIGSNEFIDLADVNYEKGKGKVTNCVGKLNQEHRLFIYASNILHHFTNKIVESYISAT